MSPISKPDAPTVVSRPSDASALAPGGLGGVSLEGESESGLGALIRDLATAAKAAGQVLRSAPTETKNAVLRRVADAVEADAARLRAANDRDLQVAATMHLSDAMIDRLRLTDARVASMAAGLRAIADLPDPVGEVAESRVLENGLRVERVRAPLGLIGIIYESRPNVTVDAAALCIKSGNTVLLRGGKEAFESNTVLADLIGQALEAEGLPRACAMLLPTTDRSATLEMIRLAGVLDLVIPRGGEGLIRFVTEHARVPVVQHYKGVCHIFVDAGADLEMAGRIVRNSKVQRPGVCNALETLLVDASIAAAFLPTLPELLPEVELRVDAAAKNQLPSCALATDADWDAEYLDLVLAVRVVAGLDEALAHVAAHGSNHTEAIVTADTAHAERWVAEVDASLVLVNASTRFNDGFSLGLGAEMGISTTKLHAYGPMGLRELCTLRWVAHGEGQIRT